MSDVLLYAARLKAGLQRLLAKSRADCEQYSRKLLNILLQRHPLLFPARLR